MIKKIKVPRRLKKRIKNAVLVIDLASIPKQFTLKDIMYEFMHTGVVWYEDTNGTKPTFISKQKPIKYVTKQS